MELKDILFISLLTLLLIFSVFLAPVAGFSLVLFQFVFAIIVYFGYKSLPTLGILLIIFIVVDSINGYNPAFSMLSFSVSGLIVALLGNVLPILKQRPFLVAKLIWLFLAIILFSVFRAAKIYTELDRIVISLIVNALLLAFITIIFEPLAVARRDEEITVG